MIAKEVGPVPNIADFMNEQIAKLHGIAPWQVSATFKHYMHCRLGLCVHNSECLANDRAVLLAEGISEEVLDEPIR